MQATNRKCLASHRVQVISTAPPSDVVVAAGTVAHGPLETMSLDEIDHLYKNNLRLCMNVTKQFFAACDKTREKPKSIVLISSNAGCLARPNQPAYAAMKAAVLSLSKSLAAAWGRYGIRVNAVAPGSVIVDRNREALRRKFPAFPADPERPSGRLCTPHDVAALVRYLISDDAWQITGETVILDGGSSL